MKKILFALFLGCTVLFVGCNKDDDGDNNNNNNNNTTTKGLVGTTWVHNGGTMTVEFSNPQASALFQPFLNMMNQSLSVPDANSTVKFNANGTYEATSSDDGVLNTSTGTYTQNGNTLTVTDDEGISTITYSISSDNILTIKEKVSEEEIADMEASFSEMGMPEGTTVTNAFLTIKWKAK